MPNQIYNIQFMKFKTKGFFVIMMILLLGFAMGANLQKKNEHKHKHGNSCIGEQQLIHIIPQQTDHRLLQNTTTHGLRMYGYSSSTSLTAANTELITRLFGISSYYFQQVLKVTTMTSSSVYPFSSSCGITVPSVFKTSGFDVNTYDMVIFLVTVQDSSSRNLAIASPCILSRWPTYGYIQFNLYHLSNDLTKTSRFHSNVYVTMHEITHILAFNPALYDKFYVSYTSTSLQPNASVISTVPGNSSRYMIITTNVKAYVQSYFACSDTAFGGLLEEEGGNTSEKSHWEREVYLDEMMTASQWGSGLKISGLTLALMKDTGYYHTVDTTLAESFLFGKNKGCNFAIGSTTNTDSQYCNSTSTNVCGFYNQFIGQCGNDDFSSASKIISPFSNTVCVFSENAVSGSSQSFGPFSRCLTANISGASGPYCLGATCINNDTQITITVGNSTGTCTSSTSTVTVGTGIVTCPTSISTFCTRKSCTNWCSAQGLCLQGTCLNANFSAVAFVAYESYIVFSFVIIILFISIL